LLHEDGRKLLNRYQVREAASSLTVAAGEGVVTTCSMYLNEHFVYCKVALPWAAICRPPSWTPSKPVAFEYIWKLLIRAITPSSTL